VPDYSLNSVFVISTPPNSLLLQARQMWEGTFACGQLGRYKGGAGVKGLKVRGATSEGGSWGNRQGGLMARGEGVTTREKYLGRV